MSSIDILTKHTPETLRARLYEHCLKNPGATIESLIRWVATTAGVKADAPIAEVFRTLADTKSDRTLPGDVMFGDLLLALLGMCAGNMAGTVSANEATAKALADKILSKLTESGVAMTKDEMAKAVLPGVDMANSPQHAADFKAALGILNDNSSVKRFTSKGEIATKRWDKMQVPPAAKSKPKQ